MFDQPCHEVHTQASPGGIAMTAVSARIQQQNAALFEYLIQTLGDEFGTSLLGILATGSRVHGIPDPSSDLDAHVIIDQPRRQRRNLVVDGIELELFINPPFQIRRYFADGRGVDPHMFTFGEAIYDPRGIVAELRAEARVLWEQGPAGIPDKERWLHRYMVADLLRDIDDVATSDEAAATMMLHNVVERLLATHARLHGRWSAKPKRQLRELERWDTVTAQLARAVLTQGALAERLVAAQRLAEHILEPLGGLMPLAWQTEWETLEP
jgi:hypothetical protein